MRKHIITFIAIFAIVVSLGACSGKEDSSEKSTETTAKKRTMNTVTSKDEVLVNEIDDALSEFFEKECQTLEVSYNNFKTAGNTEDGYKEIDTIGDVAYRSSMVISDQQIAIAGSKGSDKLDELSDQFNTAYNTFDDYNNELFDIGSADLGDDPDQAEKIAKVHDIVKNYRETVSDLGYGPCE